MKFIIENLNLTIETTNENVPLALALREQHIDWMQSCGGKGRCTTCKFDVLEGMENISPYTPAEKKYLENRQLSRTQRLACQVRISGKVVAKIPNDSKLPHLHYLDGNIKP